ncbi:hypothetical protein XI09_16985 [Bradyrhizobium sp. CCBAU 11386]|uniref:hypothetical protein n=1 Tax=Bradyrhizobium sp. CCBAU 11386 TaxID=1630837 RepID=UPI002302E82A|nr:hypothetical protein [Bradyrhizobium sp. CCBAU 11386]MDA9506296.1 hypothetical protein [Bradyrhizobium sp. CCBAU 11386]
MRKGITALLVLLASPVCAQTLEQQERLNQFDKALSALEDLKSLSTKMTNTKKTQCLTAVANQRFCECLATNLPVVVDFVQYVALVNQTKEDLEYDKQSKEDKAIIDNTRKARDMCMLVRRND